MKTITKISIKKAIESEDTMTKTGLYHKEWKNDSFSVLIMKVRELTHDIEFYSKKEKLEYLNQKLVGKQYSDLETIK